MLLKTRKRPGRRQHLIAHVVRHYGYGRSCAADKGKWPPLEMLRANLLRRLNRVYSLANQ
jgi:hypothetical protein